MVLVGQDKRELGALVFPDEEALADVANSVTDASQLETRLASEVAALNAARTDYHAEDHIAHIAVRRHSAAVALCAWCMLPACRLRRRLRELALNRPHAHRTPFGCCN